MNGDTDGDHIGAPDWVPHGPNEGQKEEEHEKGNQDREGCDHPLIQRDGSNESSPRPVGLELNEDVIQPDSLNVAGFSECGWPGAFLKSHWQWHWDLFPLHILDFGSSLFGYSPSCTWRGWRGGTWTSHRAGNPDCSLEWRGRRRGSRGSGMVLGGGAEMETFII